MTEALPMLRAMVCGSVDDGKSTLIGRLLDDAGAIPADVRAGLQRHGALDLSLATDGLAAEREQSITIDVAHRQFRTAHRRVLLLDCPGHEQYTRNMATGASGADLAIVLVDATRGVQRQTRRHLLIARLMGISSVVCVVNKMDLAGFEETRFRELAASLQGLLPASSAIIPACALDGDGISTIGRRLSWHDGPTLLQLLDEIRLAPETLSGFRMPVQWISRDDTGARYYAGTVASGHVAVGDQVAAYGDKATRVIRILGPSGAQEAAEAGQAVALQLAEARDIGRGTMLCRADSPAPVANQFQAHLVWCDETPLLPGRTYLFKLATSVVPGSITRICHAIDVDTGLPLSATELRTNDLAVVHLSLASPVAFERFAECRALGGFIMIDRQTAATAAAGMIDQALARSDSVTWQETQVSAPGRARLMAQRPLVVWFTGLSGAGKSTIANLVEARLHALGRHTALLDGDNLRHGLCRDLGFTAADRVENVRRVSEVASLMADAGLIVLVCLISPYRADRQAARERVAAGVFVEVFVDASVEECRRRDPKGLYEKADQGAIPHFTGVSAPYETPERPELHINSGRVTALDAADEIVAFVSRSG